MRIRRWAAVAAASIVAVATITVATASGASADQVWHQSVGRAGAGAPCPTTTTDELVMGWSQWGQSWERWPNGGTGGWTCTRSITWARDSAAPDGAHIPCSAWTTPDHFLRFDGVNALPIGTELYSDADCTTLSGSYTSYYWAVYANTRDEAQVICDSVIFDHYAFNQLGLDIVLGTHVWACLPTI